MVDKHELKSLSDAVSEAWKNVNFANVNGIDVCLRVVTDRTAALSRTQGQQRTLLLHLDTDDGKATVLKQQELAIVPRGTSHRLPVEGRAVLLVTDAMPDLPSFSPPLVGQSQDDIAIPRRCASTS